MSPSHLAIVLLEAPLVAFFLGLVFFRNKPAIAAGLTVAAGAVSLVAAVLLFIGGPIAEPITTPPRQKPWRYMICQFFSISVGSRSIRRDASVLIPASTASSCRSSVPSPQP